MEEKEHKEPKEKKSLSKIFKPFKREGSKSVMLSSPPIIENSSNSNSSSNNVKFSESSLVRSESNSSISSTVSISSTASTPNMTQGRPRSKSEKKDKHGTLSFNNILAKASRRKSRLFSTPIDPEMIANGNSNGDTINSNGSGSGSGDSATFSNLTSSEDLQQQQQQQQQSLSQSEKKKNRNSIFVRLLRKNKDDGNQSISEEDFKIESNSTHHNQHPHHLTNSHFTSSPNLLANSYASPLNNNNNNNHPHHPTSLTMSVQTAPSNHHINNNSNSNIKSTKNKEVEREEIIKKIQLMADQLNDPSNKTQNTVSINPNHQHLRSERQDLNHSNSSPQLIFNKSNNNSSNNLNNKQLLEENNNPLNNSIDNIKKWRDSEEYDDLSENSTLNDSMVTTEGLLSSPLSISSSSIPSSLDSPPSNNNNNTIRKRPAHLRYTVAIPKFDASMDFNGNPFERLLFALRNSTDPIFNQNRKSTGLSSMDFKSLQLIDNDNQQNLTSLSSTLNGDKQTLPQSVLDGIEEEKQKRQILLICLKKMIQKLVTESDDSALLKTFFSTYECIYSSHDILNEFILIFKNESPQIQLRICTILRNWLKDYYISEICNINFVNTFKDFVVDIKDMENSYLYSKIIEIRNQLIYLLETKINERDLGKYSQKDLENNIQDIEKQYLNKKSIMKIKTFLSTSLKSTGYLIEQHSSPQSISPPPSPKNHRLSGGNSSLSSTSLEQHNGNDELSNFDLNYAYYDNRDRIHNRVPTRPRSSTWSTSDIFLSIMDAPVKEIAKSLTAVDYSIFICIEAKELLNGAWGKPHLKDRAPNITKLISRFNEVSMNVIQSILNEEKLKDRCKVMARFIKIAKHLHELRNYNSLMAIYAGISHSSITRLKWTKKILPKTHQKTLLDLEKLMESDENFKNYRNELKTITTPCIPFLGLILSDITFIQEGNGDFVGDNNETWSLNMNKLKLMYNCIKQIQFHQKTSYLLNADPRLALLLTPNLNVFGEPINIHSPSRPSSPMRQMNSESIVVEKQQIDLSSSATLVKDDDEDFDINVDIEDDDEDEEEQEAQDVKLEKQEEQQQNKKSLDPALRILKFQKKTSEHDLLYRSFTLDTPVRKSSYSNTWSASKLKFEFLQSLSTSSGSVPNLLMERSQSETCLPLSLKPKSTNPNDLINSPRQTTVKSSNENDVAAEQQNENIESSSTTINSTSNSPNLSRIGTSSSTPSSPSNNNSNNDISITITPIEAVNNDPILLLKNNTNTGTFRKNRRKSVSTSNIHSINPNSPTANTTNNSNSGNSKSNNNSQETSPSTLKRIVVNNNNNSGQNSPNSGNTSPVGSTSQHSITHSHSSSFSLFKRKSLSIEPMLINRPSPHTFAPMTDEGLFSLSLKLEPRGVKLSELS
ncbi:hypothetical protein CYY_008382 [Polysphondylium violaceum]|uniref:Ras guanine nucleotide exchange factor n=1 Tax=Polysphondylium violaceum TaxID=133409 RepID=A0A8J4PLR9_9MYCE|nr:hypothetical protein CYY_008382 [Polysphondylium violaceum]